MDKSSSKISNNDVDYASDDAKIVKSMLDIAAVFAAIISEEDKYRLHKLTIAQSEILRYVDGKGGDGVTLKDVAKISRTSKGAASQAVSKMISMGFLEKARAANGDRRELRIRPSLTIRNSRKRLTKFFHEQFGDFFCGVAKHQVAEFVKMLEFSQKRINEIHSKLFRKK